MKCPNCGNRTLVGLDMHSGGFSSDQSPVKECGACGLVWRVKVEAGETKIDIIKPANKK
jgi:transcription elongation factor Elf1